MANFSMVTWEWKQASLFCAVGCHRIQTALVLEGHGTWTMPKDSGLAHTHCHLLHLPSCLLPTLSNAVTSSHPSQLLLGVISLLPSFTTLSPLFKNIFHFVSLSSTRDPAPCTARPGSVQTPFILVGLCSVHTTRAVQQRCLTVPGGCVSLSLAQRSSSGTLWPAARKGNVPQLRAHSLPRAEEKLQHQLSITEKLGKAQEWGSLVLYFVCNIFNAGILSGPPSFTSFLSDV